MKKTQSLRETLAEYFKEIIYGGIDGIVTTFAVVAGFAGAALGNNETIQISFMVVLLFGLANLFADAASMGLGNFLSVRSEKDLYNLEREKELSLTKQGTESQKENTRHLLMERGFNPEDADTLANLYSKNEEYWLDFLMTNAKDMADPRGENEIFTGLATFLAFMIFGSVPLIPFMIEESGDPATAFIYSIIGSFSALVFLGILKWRVIGSAVWFSLFEVVAVGSTAAVLAYLVGTLFVI